MRFPTRAARHRGGQFVAAAIAAAAASGASAMQFDTGESDFSVRWDNTFRYGAAFRVGKQNPALLAGPNTDDGDRNFDKGLISNRLELLTELDITSKHGFGFRASGLGWYDAVYNQHNDNPGAAGGASPNHTPYDQFPGPTKRTEGRKFEARDVFVFGNFNVAEMPVSLRLGQLGELWGESLFFAGNAIAGTQNAFDIGRLQADPTAQAKEFVLPVPQVTGQIQFNSEVSLSAYYQFRWRANRLPSSGSYFSVGDSVGDGAEQLTVIPGVLAAPRQGDMRPGNSGQFGLRLRWRIDETDLGFYAVRYNDKSFQQVSRLGTANVFGQTLTVPTAYYLAYNEGSTAYGASASHSFGDANVAAEVSVRRDQALASSGHAADASGLAPPGVIAPNDNRDNPGYAVGNTAHANLSTIWQLPQGPLWREALLVGEVAWNRVLSCTTHCSAIDDNSTRDGAGLRIVLSPTYRQPIAGLDISVPIGVGYGFKGSRPLALGPGALPPENGGDITVGLSGEYLAAWKFNLAYTHYYGRATPFINTAVPPYYPYGNTLRDRDFIAFTVRRTF